MIRNQWYVILEGREVRPRKPLGVKRLGEKLVLWRDEKGAIQCVADACAHRGASLSLGKVAGDCIECPFHGIRFDGEGKGRHIPANGAACPVPPNFSLRSYPVHESDGLVWIFWGDGEIAALAILMRLAVAASVSWSNGLTLFASPEQQFHAIGNMDVRKGRRLRARDHMDIEVFDRLENRQHRLVSRTKNDAGSDDRGGDYVGEGEGLLLAGQLAPPIVANWARRVRFYSNFPASGRAGGGDRGNEDEPGGSSLPGTGPGNFLGAVPIHLEHVFVTKSGGHGGEVKDRVGTVHFLFQKS